MGKVKYLLMFLAVVCFMGCARNTNSVSGNGTGLVFNTPFGQLVLGNASFHTVTSDLSEEYFKVTDTTYYNATANSGVEGVMEAGQIVQREVTVEINPVETAVVNGTWGTPGNPPDNGMLVIE